MVCLGGGYLQRASCFFLVLSALACRSKPAKQETPAFFPVVSFIGGQIHHVDSLQLPVQKLTIANNRTDTALLSIPEFKQLAKEFTTPDINDPAISKYYQENSFADQTIASITFTYATTNKHLPLQRLDVIIHPDPVLNDRVESIYMEKNEQLKDTLVLKKLYWKADRNFQIITTKGWKAQSTSSVVKVMWMDDY